MKKLLFLTAIVTMISVFPLSAYADELYYDRDSRTEVEHHDLTPQERHDQALRDHEKAWHDHEQQWSEYDREWIAHRDDNRWREEHIKMWHSWYQWHKDNESFLGMHFLDIDFTK